MGQATQAEDAVAPRANEWLPRPHRAQLELVAIPSPVWNRPAGHAERLAIPTAVW